MEESNIVNEIRGLLECRLEGVKIGELSEILNVLNTLLDDYSTVYYQVEEFTKFLGQSAEYGQHYAAFLLERAEAFYADDKFDEGAAAYRRVIKLAPDHSRAHIGLGSCLACRDRDREALPHFKRAIRIDPDDPLAHLLMGISLSKLKEHSRATVSYKRVVELDPSANFAYRALGMSLREQGMYGEATKAFQKALDLKPEAASHYELGIALGMQGNFEEAVEAFKNSIALDPDGAYTHHKLGLSLEMLGRYDEAASAFEKAADLGPDNAAVYFAMGRCFHAQGRWEEAAGAYRKALQLEPAYVSVQLALGKCLYRQGNYEDALDSFRRSAELEPDSAAAYSGIGNCLYNLDNYQEAVEAYRKSISIGLEEPDAYYFLGLSLDNLGKYDQAIEAYRHAFGLAEDISSYIDICTHYTMFERGNSLSVEGKYDKAVMAYEIAVQIKPDYADAWHNLGAALEELGKRTESVAAYRKAIELRPGDADSHNNLGLALMGLGRYEEAVEAMNEALRLRPGDALAHDNLGVCLFRQGRHAEALRSFEKAIEIDPGLATAYHHMGTAYAEQGRHDDALGAFRKAVELNPDYALALFKMSTCLIEVGRHDEALSVYRRACELEPRWADDFSPNGALQKASPEENVKRAGNRVPAEESQYCLAVRDNRLFYADSFRSYVLQIVPSPVAWVKNPSSDTWRRTRDVSIGFRHLFIGRLFHDPISDYDWDSCRLFRWKESGGQFAFEPDREDSLPLKLWAQHFDWEQRVESFFSCVPEAIMGQLKKFGVGCWELLEAAYEWDGFLDLLESNPALAVSLAMRIRVGGKKGERRKGLDYGKLVHLRQRDISAAVGFGDSESVATVLRKLVPDACTKRDLEHLSLLMEDPETMHHLQGAQQISAPALDIMGYPLMQGRLCAGIITDISREFPLTDEIIWTARGVEQLRGGEKQQEFMDLYTQMRDLVRYNPEVVFNSMEDFREKHAAMVTRLNSGKIVKSKMSFPDTPFPATEHIQPITNPKDLAMEGKEMNHCVSSYAKSILDGNAAVYRVTWPERATLSIEKGRKGWYFDQLKLRNNMSPGAETIAFVEKWLKENGIKKRRKRP